MKASNLNFTENPFCGFIQPAYVDPFNVYIHFVDQYIAYVNWM